LLRMSDMAEKLAHDIERSKTKDDQRGAEIIDDYAHAHPPADQDPFILQTWQETRRLQSELKELSDLLSGQLESAGLAAEQTA